MNKFEIKEINGKFALYKGNCSIGMITITHMLYGSFSLIKKKEYKNLMKKFGIKHVTKVVSDNKETIETFLRFLKFYMQE